MRDTLGQVSEGTQNAIRKSIGENNRGCLISAIVGGALATLPIVILTMKYSRVPRRLASVEPPPAIRPRAGNTTQWFEKPNPKPAWPHSPTRVRPGTGPFQYEGDLKWVREHPEHPLAITLGKPEWYEQANAAARGAYNQARAAGSAEEAARQASYEMYKVYLNQARGRVLKLKGVMAEIPTGQGGVTVGLILSAALLSFIPERPWNVTSSK